MIKKVEITGSVRNAPDRKITTYISAPMGIPYDELCMHREAAYAAFDFVDVRIHYDWAK